MTEVEKTNVITEPSLITAKRLTAHKIVVKDTGEVIRMTNDHRMVYSHLGDQFRGLTNPKNIAAGKSTGHYYDSDKNLEIRCDVKNTTFKKVKKDLKALGLIHWIKPKAKKSGHSCEYFVKPVDEVAHNLEFIFQELPNGKPSYDHERVSGQKTKKSKQQGSKTEDKQENGKSEPASPGDVNEVKPGCTEMQAEPQASQAETAATPATDTLANQPAGQHSDLASKPAPASVEQRDSAASNDDNGCNDRADDNNEVKPPQEPQQEYKTFKNDRPFPPEKREPEETAGRVIAPLDDLLCWFDLGNGEGMDEYGVMWCVSGDDLDSLIGKHLKTRETEAEKNFKLQRTY
ncbi:DUF6945 domain-containing protein [Biostraticola tofi]|uniref:DUF6945 domain-containing protein n=1 Tax=Biostraticola tofi TaxID=466109 RepID=A0A4R3YGJ7_9GAMM|nr:hypothetical protein [Biostraticola tofi]TCV91725.1 hypothetical protein EDC52_11547 [Biostraticola tofi]